MATAPNMNKGLALLVKHASLSPSFLVQRDFLLKSVVRTAPIGNPEVYPIAITNAPLPGTLKIGRITGSSKTLKKCTIPKDIIKLDTIKKGSNAGKTMFHQVLRPLKDASKTSLGNTINEMNIPIRINDFTIPVNDLEERILIIVLTISITLKLCLLAFSEI